MEIFLSIIFALLFYFSIRNVKVYNFLMRINTRILYLNDLYYKVCYEHLHDGSELTEDKLAEYEMLVKEYEKLVEVCNSIVDISYTSMLFSIKPLLPKYWLTEEQLKALKLNEE